MAHTEEPCRWATAGDLEAPSGKDLALIDLPKCEQVTRGAALMEMLQAPIPPPKNDEPPEGGSGSHLLFHLLTQQRSVDTSGGGAHAGMALSHAWQQSAPPPAAALAGGSCAAYGAAIMGQKVPLQTVPQHAQRPLASQPHGGWGQQAPMRAAEPAEWQRQRMAAAAAATCGREVGVNPHTPWGSAASGQQQGARMGGPMQQGHAYQEQLRTEQLDAWDAASGSGETQCSESDLDFMELSRLIDESVQLGGPGAGRASHPGVGGHSGGGNRAMRDLGMRGAPRQADAMRDHRRGGAACKGLGMMTKWDMQASVSSGAQQQQHQQQQQQHQQHQQYAAAAMAHAAAVASAVVARHALVTPSAATMATAAHTAACGWAGMGTQPLQAGAWSALADAALNASQAGASHPKDGRRRSLANFKRIAMLLKDAQMATKVSRSAEAGGEAAPPDDPTLQRAGAAPRPSGSLSDRPSGSAHAIRKLYLTHA
eukprot:CAMPEP_0176214946 /NCGR_PEP_ID=MMETSP0121_2-20121125/16431_1 /TAXON_ID=160619 /ORGANISM="Kryptoperidinium foliaceum, Strain CCMP 1326" /LENGTH=482 /DNA_ID=CAMNT_0017554045 /DNA_START=106 /DNA_END=1552 /DNA_ORIENTATION=+